MNRHRLYTIIKVGVTVCLMAFLLSRVNLAEIVEALKSASILYLVVAQVLLFSQVVVGAYRWQILLSPKGIRVPLRSLTAFYLVGSFFNRFLPTALGGDVMRGYELARRSGRGVDSATTVIMERILGLLSLFIICWISLIFSFQMLAGTNILPVVGAMSIVFILSLAILFNARLMAMVL
ncbi:MAG: lysylphosphatidylglycerol synthase transmembrane domain-containing protein, partial [Candidatus Thorarchaeota archaeon]